MQAESARLLLEHGAIVDRPPYAAKAWAPAAHVANINVTGVLLAYGADPNCRNENGDTPLHAVMKSRLVKDPWAFVELLLAAGAVRRFAPTRAAQPSQKRCSGR